MLFRSEPSAGGFSPFELFSIHASTSWTIADLSLYALGCPMHITTGKDGSTKGAQKRSRSVRRTNGATTITATDAATATPPAAIHHHNRRRLGATGVATAGTVLSGDGWISGLYEPGGRLIRISSR